VLTRQRAHVEDSVALSVRTVESVRRRV
jgi:hypothetical protein